MKSIGDFIPAPTTRDIPLEAPMADSKVMAEGSNSFLVGFVAGEGDLSSDFRSADVERSTGSLWLPDDRLNCDCDFEAESFDGDGLLPTGEGTSSSSRAAVLPVAADFGLGLKTFSNSTGKSATPIDRLAIVPKSAEAPPEIGSQGPLSVSYSRGRYLYS